jgi:rod shape-determining protein MreC
MKNFFRENAILLFLIALLLAGIVAVFSAILGLSPLSNLLGILSSPFRNGVSAVTGWLEEQYDYAFEYDALVDENAALRKRVAELEQDNRAAQDANRQNELYRQLLGFAERHADFELEDATVTQRSASNWSYAFTINKGTNAALEVGDCAIDAYGNLVGIISQTGYNWATLSAVIDPSTEMGGRIPRTDDDALLEGDFSLMLDGALKLAYLPENTMPISGDQVTTSSLGEKYPADLVVGAISSIHTDASGLTRYAVVRPSADLAQIKYVFVIKSFEVVS